MSGYRGLKAFLAGNQVTSLSDAIVPAAGQRLPEMLKITVHKGECLYKPTMASMLKFSPFVSCYLTPEKHNKQSTLPKIFATENPQFDAILNMVYKGQPLLVVQAWDSDMMRNEFIGETPVDLLSIINTFSRKWTGALTVWGQKGTADHGRIWVTIEFIGGDPYDPSEPAAHKSENAAFEEDGRSPLNFANLKKVAKSAACC